MMIQIVSFGLTIRGSSKGHLKLAHRKSYNYSTHLCINSIIRFFRGSMDVTFVSRPKMIIMGKELRTTWMDNECYKAIPQFWQKQKEQNIFAKIPNKVTPERVVGLYTNYTDDFSLTSGYYSLIIGCPVTSIDTIPEGMCVKEVPAQKYALFSAKGPFAESIGKVWLQEIWPNQKLNRSFTYDFEWYDEKSTDDQNSIVSIYIAIK